MSTRRNFITAGLALFAGMFCKRTEAKAVAVPKLIDDGYVLREAVATIDFSYGPGQWVAHRTWRAYDENFPDPTIPQIGDPYPVTSPKPPPP